MIRKAEYDDLDEIMRVYDAARAYMRRNGNMVQWINGYPQRELLTKDIEDGSLYVDTRWGKVHGVFALIVGEDPTYGYIENGEWLNDAAYGTIHRLGSDGRYRHMLKGFVEFCEKELTGRGIYSLRCDTHADNVTMNYLMDLYGFVKCGVIYIADGTPRTAYQKLLGNKYCECPCCGKKVFTQKNAYEICPSCGWEDDPVQRRDPDYTGGANSMSLNEARAKYRK